MRLVSVDDIERGSDLMLLVTSDVVCACAGGSVLLFIILHSNGPVLLVTSNIVYSGIDYGDDLTLLLVVDVIGWSKFSWCMLLLIDDAIVYVLVLAMNKWPIY